MEGHPDYPGPPRERTVLQCESRYILTCATWDRLGVSGRPAGAKPVAGSEAPSVSPTPPPWSATHAASLGPPIVLVPTLETDQLIAGTPTPVIKTPPPVEFLWFFTWTL